MALNEFEDNTLFDCMHDLQRVCITSGGTDHFSVSKLPFRSASTEGGGQGPLYQRAVDLRSTQRCRHPAPPAGEPCHVLGLPRYSHTMISRMPCNLIDFYLP